MLNKRKIAKNGCPWNGRPIEADRKNDEDFETKKTLRKSRWHKVMTFKDMTIQSCLLKCANTQNKDKNDSKVYWDISEFEDE